ncbi:histidine kinase [Polaribacter batillariae]|uniref:Histidine kinase n=1 Tax=Polaribacter batillariae TaxID=2808900 RepID=A0ABX7SXV3_9FLAO|nr:histidine kinase [Polaribacter batillariae]QTD39084.1 histidine kinase [Polaribacter batillariae]
MGKLDNWIDNKIVQNLFIWVFLFIIFTMVIQAENRLLASLLFIAFIAPPVYINNLKILPLFFNKKVKLAVVLFLLNVCFFSFLVVAFLSNGFKRFELKMLLNAFGALLLILIFGIALKLAKESFTRRQQEKEAELKLLKAQLNPHFLFNTLNNLYGLSVIKSDKLPNLMLKLSDLLRYSLYETSTIFVPLEKEIKYLENYIALERIRLEDKADIIFEVSGAIESLKIAPMLCIVFVENAFKHLGVLENGKSSVSVKIVVNSNEIYFSCTNTVEVFQIESSYQLEKGKSGIGLQNAKKRLALLYPNKHQLRIEKTESLYCVTLKLDQ